MNLCWKVKNGKNKDKMFLYQIFHVTLVYVYSWSWVLELVETDLFRRIGRGIRSRSSRTRIGSSPLCRCRCSGRGCSGTVWAALWSRKVWPPRPSAPRRCAWYLYSGRPWTGPARSQRSHNSAEPSTPPSGTPGHLGPQADHPDTEHRPGPESHSLRERCRVCAQSLLRWYLKGDRNIRRWEDRKISIQNTVLSKTRLNPDWETASKTIGNWIQAILWVQSTICRCFNTFLTVKPKKKKICIYKYKPVDT